MQIVFGSLIESYRFLSSLNELRSLLGLSLMRLGMALVRAYADLLKFFAGKVAVFSVSIRI